MNANPDQKARDEQDEFSMAAGSGRSGLVGEFVEFLKHNKKWWLLPIVLAVIIVGVIIAVSGTGAAPFIYPLF